MLSLKKNINRNSNESIDKNIPKIMKRLSKDIVKPIVMKSTRRQENVVNKTWNTIVRLAEDHVTNMQRKEMHIKEITAKQIATS